MQKNIILSMFEQKLFNLPCWPDINEHAAKEISQWSDLVEPLDWFPPLMCKIIWLSNRKFVKLLGLFLIRCVFTKKNLRGQKFVKIGTGKNRGFPEHCALHCALLCTYSFATKQVSKQQQTNWQHQKRKTAIWY